MKIAGYVFAALAAAALWVTGPVLITSVQASAERQLDGVMLDEVTYEEVAFTNTDAGLELGGMLLLPKGDGPFPGAVLIHGSGSSHRDNRWYLTLAKHLQSSGVAVLVPDKRGCEESEGDWRAASMEELATDTHAALAWLRGHDRVDADRVGVIGLSQGGRIAPIVAAEDARTAFAVNLVGDAVPFHDALYYEEVRNLEQMGLYRSVARVAAYPSTWYIRHVAQSDFWSAVGNHDPMDYWQQVDVPALAIYGAKDTNCPTKASAERLRALERDNLTVRVFKGSGHALEDPPSRGNALIRVEVLDAVSEFISAATAGEAKSVLTG